MSIQWNKTKDRLPSWGDQGAIAVKTADGVTLDAYLAIVNVRPPQDGETGDQPEFVVQVADGPNVNESAVADYVAWRPRDVE